MNRSSIRLGINIDHVATLRQARLTQYPDPIHAAFEAEQGGADSITIHLREDRRHIQERDLYLLKETCQTKINLEMATTQEMLSIAKKVKPAYCCLVPEKRNEVTTEGGLDVSGQLKVISHFCNELAIEHINVALFIEPEIKQIDAALASGATSIEIHTGKFSEYHNNNARENELKRIKDAVRYAHNSGIEIHAGHGLNYQNVSEIAAITEITELNIGHAIISRAIISGLKQAVYEMKSIITASRNN